MLRNIILSLALVAGSVSAYDQGQIVTAQIMRTRPSNLDPTESRVTIKVPEIPIGWWVNCDYYDSQPDVIASTHHVLRSRVTTWSVIAPHDSIRFVFCYTP